MHVLARFPEEGNNLLLQRYVTFVLFRTLDDVQSPEATHT
jgi:hypothetical protein